MRRQAFLLLILFGLVGCRAPTEQTLLGGPPSSDSTQLGQDAREVEMAFEWFDTLGFEDVAGKAFVKVATGQWSRVGSEPAKNKFIYAFLLNEAGDEFEVQTLDLFVQTFVKTPKDKPEHEAVWFEPADLRQIATERLEWLQARARGEIEEDTWRRFGERVGERTEIFAFGRACKANGLDALASDLVAQAAALKDRRSGKPPERGKLKAALSEELAYAMIWRAFLAFEDAKAHDRAALLAAFEAFSANYPESEHTERARGTAALLSQMIEEDEAHAAAAHKPIASLSTSEKVDRLIFELRDQNGHQWSQPGACDIFNDARGAQSPAAQLVALGYDAVPQLIEVVDDKRFTRSVGYHRDFYFSHHVLRVGDAARAIIERIAGRSFYTRTYTNAAMVKDGQASETKALIEAWWQALQTKGEAQVLIEATQAGDHNSIYQGRALRDKYPDKALDPLIKGALNAENGWVRSSMLELIGAIPGKKSHAFLTSEMKKAPSLRTRVVAARNLHRLGDKQAAAAMIKAWKTLPAIPSGDPENPEDGVSDLINFLAGCGEVAAVEVLGKGWMRHPVARRLSIVWAFGDANNFSSLSTGQGGSRPPSNAPGGQAPPVEKAIEVLLTKALDDVEEREGMSGMWDDKSFVDPRICDLAGHVLTKRWPRRYTFDLSASLDTRERGRLTLKNVWLASKGLPLVPIPTIPAIVPVSDSVLDPLLLRYRRATTDEARRDAAAPIEALGLSALPGVRKAMDDKVTTEATRASLGLLASRLASTIRTIKLDGLKPNKALATRLAALQGQPLSAQTMLDLMLSTMRDPPKGAQGINLHAHRHDGGLGVTLKVTILDTAEAKTGSQEGWAQTQRISAGPKHLLSTSGFMSVEYGLKAEGYKEFIKRGDEATASDSTLPFTLRLGIVRQR